MLIRVWRVLVSDLVIYDSNTVIWYILRCSPNITFDPQPLLLSTLIYFPFPLFQEEIIQLKEEAKDLRKCKQRAEIEADKAVKERIKVQTEYNDKKRIFLNMHERHSEMEKQNEKLETKLEALRKESTYHAVKIQNQQTALKAIHRYKLVTFWLLNMKSGVII